MTRLPDDTPTRCPWCGDESRNDDPLCESCWREANLGPQGNPPTAGKPRRNDVPGPTIVSRRVL